MKITIIGTGYVGLVTGVCLSDIGHIVTCVDNNKDKINALNNGKVPIYEPGLDELIVENTSEHRLFFTSDLKSCINDSDLVFIAVGTPQESTGETNLKYVYAVAKEIAECITKDVYIVIKSTVPVGTSDAVKDIIYNNILDTFKGSLNVFISSNPEFLKEGTAIHDFTSPERIVIGTDDDESKYRLTNLYQKFFGRTIIQYTDVKSAQLIKYASNSFLATKISFVSSLIPYCEKVHANIEDVVFGMGLDSRIGLKFLKPGIGFGGSCFPKDVASLSYEYQKSVGNKNLMLDSTLSINNDARAWPIHKLYNYYKHTKNRGEKGTYEFSSNHDLKIAILGLAFKPETDDVRCAPSIDIITGLSQYYKINAYDPIAIENAKRVLNDTNANFSNITFYDNIIDTVTDTDIIILVTEWKEFANLSNDELMKIFNLMKGDKLFFDCRNVFNPFNEIISKFNYYSVGRPSNK